MIGALKVNFNNPGDIVLESNLVTHSEKVVSFPYLNIYYILYINFSLVLTFLTVLSSIDVPERSLSNRDLTDL